mmetsp:Transcript_48183/g.148736  ORF Transcript_48183/g.148736 Transcript_48183/m.148736 type:complete len:85 (+) Transcript_48183:568-822(+)
MDPAFRAAPLIRELRALSGTPGALALADRGPLAVMEPNDEGMCNAASGFSVGGVVLWVSGSRRVVAMAQGGFGMVVVPSWGTVP